MSPPPAQVKLPTGLGRTHPGFWQFNSNELLYFR